MGTSNRTPEVEHDAAFVEDQAEEAPEVVDEQAEVVDEQAEVVDETPDETSEVVEDQVELESAPKAEPDRVAMVSLRADGTPDQTDGYEVLVDDDAAEVDGE